MRSDTDKSLVVVTIVCISLLGFFAGYQLFLAGLPGDVPNGNGDDWDTSIVVSIELKGDSIAASHSHPVVVNGSRATIFYGGTYSVAGSLDDGQIVVFTDDEDPVRLILNGVNIKCSTSAPICIMEAEETFITMADGTENFVEDGASYVFDESVEGEPNAAVFCKSDLTISGNGLLKVIGNFNDGIACKDGLVIQSGTVEVRAVDDGISGRDYVVVEDGVLSLDVGGDGLKADNAENATLGYVSVINGEVNVVSVGDAVQAEKSVFIANGTFNLRAGGGSGAAPSGVSAKGIKGLLNVTVDGGLFVTDSADDALHSNGTLAVNGGSFTLSSGDDALHGDVSVEVNGGEINVVKSVEGIEGGAVTIYDGELRVVSAEDGVHVFSNMTGAAGGSLGELRMHGGSLSVSSGNDAIHADGYVEVNGGEIMVLQSLEGIEAATVTVNGGNLSIVSIDDGIDAVAVTGVSDSGAVTVADGVVKITSGGDAVQAERNVLITGGSFSLVSGGGFNNIIGVDASAKGVKGATGVTINGGTFEIDSADDAIHSNGVVTVNGGSFDLLSGDETIYADGSLQLKGGDIDILNSSQDPGDAPWDAVQVVDVGLNGNSVTVNSPRAGLVRGNILTIMYAGTYRIAGSLTDGQIFVNTKDSGVVKLILNGAHVGCSTSAPICVLDADKVVVFLEAETENSVSDGASYVFGSSVVDEPNAAVYSRSELVFQGSGVLNVDGNCNDGIASNDGLTVESGTIVVSAVDDGIRGKDFVVIKGGSLAIDVGGDGVKSDNVVDPGMGYVSIEDVVLNIRSGGDAVEAQANVVIGSGDFDLTTGGSSFSAKGVKGGAGVTIESGDFVINSADDAVHSNGVIVINGGLFTISTGDDGIHADSSITLTDAVINIAGSFEGIEAPVVTINSGDIHVVSSDDGVNMGVDSGIPPFSPPGARFSLYSGNYYLIINGGYLAVNALGDGIDSNGAVVMSGGVVIVDGPSSDMNSALDHVAFNVTGGYLVAVGSSGMALPPGDLSTQYSVMLNFRTAYPAGTLIHVRTSGGEELFTYNPAKRYQSVVFSTASLALGSSYDVYVGGSHSGALKDGLYSGGTYTPGTRYTSFTISSMVTRLGPSGGFFPPLPP